MKKSIADNLSETIIKLEESKELIEEASMNLNAYKAEIDNLPEIEKPQTKNPFDINDNELLRKFIYFIKKNLKRTFIHAPFKCPVSIFLKGLVGKDIIGNNFTLEIYFSDIDILKVIIEEVRNPNQKDLLPRRIYHSFSGELSAIYYETNKYLVDEVLDIRGTKFTGKNVLNGLRYIIVNYKQEIIPKQFHEEILYE